MSDRSSSVFDRIKACVGTQSALAKRLGVSAYAVTKWKKNQIPAERVLDIERACNGAVTRHDLRPDLYPRDHAA
jgi:DNA-binding transcriptional regulator YdaS (Cro superfamily)